RADGIETTRSDGVISRLATGARPCKNRNGIIFRRRKLQTHCEKFSPSTLWENFRIACRYSSYVRWTKGKKWQTRKDTKAKSTFHSRCCGSTEVSYGRLAVNKSFIFAYATIVCPF